MTAQVLLDVWVPGHPRTKGSLTVKGTYVEDTPQSRRWRMLVAERARAHKQPRTAPYDGPVSVQCTFWLPAPLHDLGASALAIYYGSGDTDKLERNVLDALSAPRPNRNEERKCAGVYVDDRQVHEVWSRKFLVLKDSAMGAHVMVTTVDVTNIELGRGAAWMRASVAAR